MLRGTAGKVARDFRGPAGSLNTLLSALKGAAAGFTTDEAVCAKAAAVPDAVPDASGSSRDQQVAQAPSNTAQQQDVSQNQQQQQQPQLAQHELSLPRAAQQQWHQQQQRGQHTEEAALKPWLQPPQQQQQPAAGSEKQQQAAAGYEQHHIAAGYAQRQQWAARHEQQQQQQRPGHWRRQHRTWQQYSRSSVGMGVQPNPHERLSPPALNRALCATKSFGQIDRLLRAQAAEVNRTHLFAALSRMGQLVGENGGRQPTPAQQAAFKKLRQRIFDVSKLEGQNLSLQSCCQLAVSSAFLQLPLSPQQQAEVEQVVLGSLPGAQPNELLHLLSSYLRLGMQPGRALAVALAPQTSLRTIEVPAGFGQPPEYELEFRPLDPAALTNLLSLSVNLVKLLRILVLHSTQLNSTHLLTALTSLVKAHIDKDLEPSAVTQETFRCLREWAFREVEREGGTLSLLSCAKLLQLSADMAVPLAPAQQEAIEKVAVAGLPRARFFELQQIVAAYDTLDMQPGSEAMQAALVAAAERMLPAARPTLLCTLLTAWSQRGWPVTPALTAAAEQAALATLDGSETAGATKLLLEAFAAGGWQLSPALTAGLREGVLRVLSTELDAWFAINALSCCRKLGLLPYTPLHRAFVRAARRTLPVSPPRDACLFVHVCGTEGWNPGSDVLAIAADVVQRCLASEVAARARRAAASSTSSGGGDDGAVHGSSSSGGGGGSAHSDSAGWLDSRPASSSGEWAASASGGDDAEWASSGSSAGEWADSSSSGGGGDGHGDHPAFDQAEEHTPHFDDGHFDDGHDDGSLLEPTDVSSFLTGYRLLGQELPPEVVATFMSWLEPQLPPGPHSHGHGHGHGHSHARGGGEGHGHGHSQAASGRHGAGRSQGSSEGHDLDGWHGAAVVGRQEEEP